MIRQAVSKKHKQGQCERPQRTAKATVSPGNLPVSRIVDHLVCSCLRVGAARTGASFAHPCFCDPPAWSSIPGGTCVP